MVATTNAHKDGAGNKRASKARKTSPAPRGGAPDTPRRGQPPKDKGRLKREAQAAERAERAAEDTGRIKAAAEAAVRADKKRRKAAARALDKAVKAAAGSKRRLTPKQQLAAAQAEAKKALAKRERG